MKFFEQNTEKLVPSPYKKRLIFLKFYEGKFSSLPAFKPTIFCSESVYSFLQLTEPFMMITQHFLLYVFLSNY